MRVYSVKRLHEDVEPEHHQLNTHEETRTKRVKRAPQPRFKKERLTQMTIDLGGNKIKKCPTCEMEYVASSEEDAKLHKQYHSLSTQGLDMPPKLLQLARTVTTSESVKAKGLGVLMSDRVVEISRSDVGQLRRIATNMLGIAEKDLGAIRTSDATLWGANGDARKVLQKPLATRPSNSLTSNADAKTPVPSRVFIYVRDRTCVGLCLIKNIRKARKVIRVESASDSAHIHPSDELFPAKLGISRIWVSRQHRRGNIALRLLDAARTTTSNGGEVAKEDMAFSQPTAAGAALARSWFGTDYGWLVFDDDT